jgi:hypothetical protein
MKKSTKSPQEKAWRTRRTSQDFVREFLERVNGKVLDEYRATIKQLIHGHAGVYALYKGEKLYYVGLARNLMSRVNTHLKDRHTRKWDRFSVYLTTENNHIRPLEALLLRIVSPEGNRVGGKLAGAKDIGRQLNTMMSDSDANKRARLIGGTVARRRRKTTLSAVRGSLGLAGLLERRMSLIGHYKGEKYRASILKSGRIRYKGRLFNSPTSAAKAIVGRIVNGWKFWTYQKTRGEWVPLGEFRR